MEGSGSKGGGRKGEERVEQSEQKHQNAKDWDGKGERLTSPSVSTMSPRVTALAPSLAAATSEFPDDGEADANRNVVFDAVVVISVAVAVAVAAFAATALLAIGGSSVAHAAVEDDDEVADVEAIAPATMREAALRSIVGGEGDGIRLREETESSRRKEK